MHPLASEFFPRLPAVTVAEGARDAHGRRSWIVGAAMGEDARRLEGLFARCGCYRGFMFRVPGTDKAVVARFEDHLPLVKDGKSWRTDPVVVRQMLAE